MSFNATIEQEKAINAKGNILVSAAAGSGKTAVLVERVIKKLCDKENGIRADELLIVTFTNAAAAEMRTRIEKKLDEKIRENSWDENLNLQKRILSSSKICTIDSFCIDLVRENFDKLGVSPDFKISDGYSLISINESVAQKIIDRYIENKEPLFLELLDLIGAEFDEKNFREFLLKIYEYSRQMPFPKKWFNNLSGNYNGGKFSSDNLWYKYAFAYATVTLTEVYNSILNAIQLLQASETAIKGYYDIFSSTIQQLYNLLEISKLSDWDKFYNALNTFFIPKIPSIKGLSGIENVSAAKNALKYVKEKAIDKLQRIFYADFDFINSQFSKIYKPLSLLTDILIELDDSLFEEYNKNNTFTFHNTEHLALSLLCEEKDGDVVIEEDAMHLLDQYKEVMVDEYQDTNNLQDMLFFVLSNREKRLFVVGDVKQSIYGFRAANPQNFLNKKNRYVPIDSADSNMPQKIILSNNFRCKPEVCEFINYFFEMFMTKQTGDIVYDGEERLVPSAVYPQVNVPATQFHILDCSESDLPQLILQARHIAKYIKNTLKEGAVIRVDENNLRNVKYSDFTVLLRSTKRKAPIICEELKKQGIPVNYGVEGFADGIEISTFLSLLSVIDNPQTDIELLCVLFSPFFSFSADEIGNIRAQKRDGNLYSAVVFASQNGNEKAKNFLKTIEKFRVFAVTNTIPQLISILLNEIGYLDIVSVMNDGTRRRNNLLLLLQYAQNYIADNTASLSGFVKYIYKQSENGMKSAGSDSNTDAVKIMSIHASKGLQFPICIIADLDADFNDSEAKQNVLYTTDFGIGFKYFDEQDKHKYTSIGREVMLTRIRNERLEEEMRLLYVAMTRTQDRLMFLSSVSNLAKKTEDLKSILLYSNCEINSHLFKRTRSYNDWLMLALLLHPDGKELRGNGSNILVSETKSSISLSVECVTDEKDEKAKICEISDSVDTEILSAIKENIGFKYPYSEILQLESKASVSKLANSAESVKFAFSAKPSFMNNGGITAAERGTAMHKVMQFFTFSNYKNIEQEINRLYEWQYISEAEAKSLNTELIKKFFESDVFKRILNSSRVENEMRFITEIASTELDNTLPDRFKNEKIIVQGAVDVCFVEDDGLVVLDFKTDRVTDINDLAKTYAEQLNIYAIACEKIFEMPVKQKIIYSFSLSQEIEV